MFEFDANLYKIMLYRISITGFSTFYMIFVVFFVINNINWNFI